MAAQQLLLPLETENLLRFDNFYAAEASFTVQTLQHWDENFRLIYLAGDQRTGKTHLAEAVAAQFLAQGKTVIFLSGRAYPPPHLFYDLPHVDCVIVDDIDFLLEVSTHYEEALFALYNKIFDSSQTRLLLTSNLKIDALPLHLQDLKSRLHGMLNLDLYPLSSVALPAALKLHAERLHLHLSDSILMYLAKKIPRLCEQIKTLKMLAEYSLIERKPLSLHSIKRRLKEKNVSMLQCTKNHT